MRTFLVIAVVLYGLSLTLLGGLALGGTTSDSVGRVCFSKQSWSANDKDRPCVSIRVYEDGTYSGAVHPARFGTDSDVR